MQTLERNNMDLNTTNLVTTIASKPVTGVSISLGAYILHIFALISPYLTMAALAIGLAASIWSFIANRREARYYKRMNEHLDKEEQSEKNKNNNNKADK